MFSEFPNSNIIYIMIRDALTSKADKATTLTGYGITDAYTKTETDGKISSAISAEETARDIAIANAINSVKDSAPEAFDTLKEIADWIQDDQSGAAAMAEQIASHTTQLQNKVDKVDGKGLSTNDYTTNEKTKLSGVDAGAQVNVIETVKVNGTALTPDGNKAVDVSVPVSSVNSKTGSVKLAASDVGALGNTGNQMLDGNLQVGDSAEENIHLLKDTATVVAENVKNNYSQYSHTIPNGTKDDILALRSDIYAAVQQIAPAFEERTDQNPYNAGDLVSKDGVVYQCADASFYGEWSAWSWDAKKVSELFLPLTGGEISGVLKCNSIGMRSGPLWFGDSATNADLAFVVSGNPRTPMILTNGAFIYFPYAPGTLALLQNLAANYSTSATYALNQLCVYSNKLYRCTTAITTAEAWTAAHWTEATVQDVLAAIWTALGDIPSWAKATNKPSYTLNEVCQDSENWLGVPGTTAAGKSIKVLAKTVSGVIEGGLHVTGSSNNDNNITKYRYGGVTVTRNGVATDYLFDGSQSGIARLGNVRYDMPTAVALAADNDEATLVCADRAVTNATIATGFSTLNLTFPTAVTGKVRDFYLRIVVAAGESAPALSIPQGITIENPDGAVPEIADGETSAASTTLVWFSETAPNVFTAKAETVKAVA